MHRRNSSGRAQTQSILWLSVHGLVVVLLLLAGHTWVLLFVLRHRQHTRKKHLFPWTHERIPPLPVHPQPQPWEELSSFLARTARSMHYPDPHWLLHPEMLPSPITSHNLSLLTAPADYAFLAALLALSEEQLYAMTLHPLDVLSRHLFCFPPFYHSMHSRPPRTSQSTPLAPTTLTQQVAQFSCLSAQTTQICTLCLQESIPYDRLYWKVKYLITCPKHRIFLARACSRCRRPVPSTRMDPLTCPSCKHPYHTASLSVPTDASFLLHGDLLTFHALDVPSPSMPSPFLPPENDPRSTLPGAHYLALLRALSLSMRPFPASEIHRMLPSSLSPFLTERPARTLTPQERLPPLHITAIHWIFSQWPDHFITFRTAFQAHRQRSGKKQRDFPFLPDTFRAQAPQAYRLFFP